MSSDDTTEERITYSLHYRTIGTCDWYYGGNFPTLEKAKEGYAYMKNYNDLHGIENTEYRIVKTITTIHTTHVECEKY